MVRIIYNRQRKVGYEMKRYISIDIGGTAIKYGVIQENAEIILKKSMRTEAWKGYLGKSDPHCARTIGTQ